NMDSIEDRDLLESISDEVYALVKRYNGIFWGEHGKGIRGQYLRDFVGEVAYQSFLDIKHILDPGGRFNPGKLVNNSGNLYGIRDTPFRVQNNSGQLEKAYSCNGNAACLDYNARNTMCPSFKATLDLKNSPKGRSEILRAWDQAKNEGTEYEDLEQQAFSSLDKCLGCKACAGTCPMQVDIPEMKSIFLESYYSKRSMPGSARLAIALEKYAPIIQRYQNFLRIFDRKILRNAFGKFLGLKDLPGLTPPISHKNVNRLATFEEAVAKDWNDKTVFLIQDPFTSLFDANALSSIAGGLEILGYQPKILPLLPAGKAAHTNGARESFARQAKNVVEQLNIVAKKGVPLVGIDPAFVLMFRGEIKKMGMPQNFELLLIQEYLCNRINLGDQWPVLDQKADIKVFLHCTEQSIAKTAAENWQSVFEILGLNAEIAETGCCGMAGMFGHENSHYEISRKIFELSWTEAIEDDKIHYATGFSCRCQTKRFANQEFRHPMNFLTEMKAKNSEMQSI
ncbi:MAG: FAD-linked oxidase C-terminal domain-containing protein, partial [Sneathiella sp.]